MQRMLAVLAANPAADGAGLVAMVCFIAWPLFQARRMMLVAYIGNNLCFALHYALLGHWTAVAMNGLMSVQTVVAIMLVRQPRLRFAYYGLMPVLALASAVTWQGVPSFLAAAATTLSTIGRMRTNDVILRVLLLAATPFWAVHDLIVGSFPGLIADVLSMATGATVLLWHSRCADRSDPHQYKDHEPPRSGILTQQGNRAMTKNLALAASIMMLVAISGQAFAGTAAPKARYWPKATDPSDRQAVSAFNAYNRAVAPETVEPNAHRYYGGPKSNY